MEVESALLEETSDYYVFLLGILSSEFEGERIFNQSSGLTSMAGGTITTEVIQDASRQLIIDFTQKKIIARKGATIQGAIQFEKGEGENDLGTAIEKLDNVVYGGMNLIGRVSMKAQNGGYFINTVAEETLFGEEVRLVDKQSAGAPPICALYPIQGKLKAGIPYVASVYIRNKNTPDDETKFGKIIFRNITKGVNFTDVWVSQPCESWTQIHTSYTFTEEDLQDNIGIYVYVHYGASGITYASCLKLQEGNKPTEGFEANLSTLNTAMQGSTDIIGGLVLTNTVATRDSGNHIKSGMSALSDNDNVRFWAGSTSWDDVSSAPFRVYEDGKVFATNFYGFHSAYRVTEEDITDYFIDVREFGSKILLDMPTGLANALEFPSGMEYVGAEIELYNPYNRPIAICNQNIISPTIATLSNAFDFVGADDHLSGYAYIYKENKARLAGSGYTYSIPRWSLKNITCSMLSSMPNYMKWKCVCFVYASDEYSGKNIDSGYYIRVGQSAYVYFLPLWVLAESSSDITFDLEIG